MPAIQVVLDQALLDAADCRDRGADRVGRRVARLDEMRMRAVCRSLGFALGCEA